MSNVLHCRKLTKSYFQTTGKKSAKKSIETKVLNALDLTVASGELLAIVGSSGCGKSTFLHIAGALDSPTTGEVWINDTNIHQLSE